ncbi:MAG: tetratricopeptide repeat protein [Candidatus Lokiarchaeota archaeon]|nr:tetratricopeptide repeat protein [Candidatus Lokiarchaeota archaeon]
MSGIKIINELIGKNKSKKILNKVICHGMNDELWERVTSYWNANTLKGRSYKMAVGVNPFTAKFYIYKNRYKISVWDFSSASRFKSLRPKMYVGGVIALIFYDLQSPESARNLQQIIQEVKDSTTDLALLLICYSKELPDAITNEEKTLVGSLSPNDQHLRVALTDEREWFKIFVNIYFAIKERAKRVNKSLYEIDLYQNMVNKLEKHYYGIELFESLDASPTSLISKNDQFIFLTGAGISIEPPTSLDSAKQITNQLIHFFAPENEFDGIESLDTLRYEVVVSWVQEIFDPHLDVLNYFESVEKPNIYHYLLGYLIMHGHNVVTTNFDYLIENALINLLKDEECNQIMPIITKKDYKKYEHYYESLKSSENHSKLYPVFKLHGSKKNIITKEDTTETLVTTLEGLSKNQSETKAFDLVPYKKDAFAKVIDNRTLIVLGYSGTDEFDIGPMLHRLKGINRLIWIEHHEEMGIAIEIIKVNWIYLKDTRRIPTILKDFITNAKFDLYLLKGDTKVIIESLFREKVKKLKSENQSEISADINLDTDKDPGNRMEKRKEELSIWLKNNFHPNLIDKLRFAYSVHLELGNSEHLVEIAKRGINLAEKESNNEALSYFAVVLGDQSIQAGALQDAEKYYKMAILKSENHSRMWIIANLKIGNLMRIQLKYEESLDIYYELLKHVKNIDDLYLSSQILHQMGLINIKMQNLDKARECYERALEIEKDLGDIDGRTESLIYLGKIRVSMEILKEALQNAFFLHNNGHIAKCFFEFGEIIKQDSERRQKAIQCYKEALKYNQKTTNKELMGDILFQLASVSKKSRKYLESIKYFKDAEKVFELFDQKESIDLCHEKRIEIAEEIGSEHTIRNKQPDIALEYYQQAYDIYEEFNDIKNMALQLENIGKVYHKINDDEKAQEYFEKANKLDKDYTRYN